jgi:hypothetical protein
MEKTATLYIGLAYFFALILTGCTSASRQVDQLRIINNGSYPIKNLVVRFPEDNIAFGDVPVGMTTEYKEVPNGVFSYAAYKFEVDDKVFDQFVIDWIGEEPMDGSLFTYIIDFDPSRFLTNDGIQVIRMEINK